jgi:ATP-dependent RNA helicase DDX19/DBP5
MLNQQGLGDQCKRLKLKIENIEQILLYLTTFSDPVVKFARKYCLGGLEITVPKDDLSVAGST